MKLKKILLEGAKEKAAEDFLSKMIKKSKWKGKVFIAGGYVRDELMGLDPKDIDITVNAKDGGIKFAEWITKEIGVYKKGSNPVIYPKFGTAQFRLKGIVHKGQDISKLEIESVMTRKEKYTKGSRKPEVSGGSLKDDVERRDFTANSLLKDLTTGEILDLTGKGRADLAKGYLRTPLDPDITFKDDPLRMLRAIRFTVKYNWILPLFMIKSLKRNASTLKNISSERIRTEFDKMMISSNPDKAIRLLQMTGLNKHVAPELDSLVGMKQNKYHDRDAMKHTLAVLKSVPPKLTTRLAALFHDVGKSTTRKIIDNEVTFYKHEEVSAEMVKAIMTRLKYPNEVIDQVSKTVANHMRTKQYGNEAETVTDKTIRKLKADLGDHLEDTLDLIHADNISHGEEFNMPHQVSKLKNRLKDLEKEPMKPVLPINGDDIIRKFKIKPGKDIGIALAAVKDAWYENPSLSKKDALDIVGKLLGK